MAERSSQSRENPLYSDWSANVIQCRCSQESSVKARSGGPYPLSKTTIEIIELEPLVVRPTQAAQMLSISLRKFHSMRACGQLPPAIKVGGCLLYRVKDLRRFVELGFPCLEKFLVLQKGDKK